MKKATEPIVLDYIQKTSAPGYESLAEVLHRAFIQAAQGKGKERHAGRGEAFEDQMMQDMAKRFGVGVLLGQAFKKSEESQRLPHDAAVRELLGAINYLAGAVIHMERKHQAEQSPLAANDNRPAIPIRGPAQAQAEFGQTCCKESGGGCTGCPRNG